MLSRLGWALALGLVTTTVCRGQAPVELDTHIDRREVGPFAAFLEDDTRTLEVVDAQRRVFEPFGTTRRNIGYSQSAFWLRFSVRSRAAETTRWYLLLADIRHHAVLYQVRDDGRFSIQRDGPDVPPEAREIKDRRTVFPLTLAPGETQNFYLRYETDRKLNIGPILLSSSALVSSLSQQSTAEGLYYGLIVAMVLYNFFLFLLTRERAYFFYVFFQATFAFCQLNIDGIGGTYLWTGDLDRTYQVIILFAAFSYLGAIAFARDLLESSRRAPRLDIALRALLFVAGAIATASLFTGSTALLKFILAYLIVAAVVLVASAAVALHDGNKNALYYLVGWVVFLLGCILYPLDAFGVVPANPITPYSLKIGSALEAVLLSFALANRIRLMREEKERAQADRLREREIATQTLENRVRERTADLTSALRELKETQTRLVHQARMASLGNLVAGVAHEVGNPLNFALGGAQEVSRRLETATTDISALTPEALESEKVLAITKRLTQARRAVELVKEGHQRIHEIIRNLRAYTQWEIDAVQRTGVWDALESTLSLMESKLRQQGIEVQRTGDREVAVDCRPGEMGQLFMNLLLNACEAMPKGGAIYVEVTSNDGSVTVTFGDTGPGVALEHRDAVFDPFFTTRTSQSVEDSGGTGLGLSISQQIVERTGGTIALVEQEGRGAVFEMRMPQSSSEP